LTAGASSLKAAVLEAERSFDVECRRLHYLSVPPNAALSAVRLLGEAGLVDRARIIMEKPFGTNLASAVSLNSKLHEVFAEEQLFRIDHVQIDVPEKLGLGKRGRRRAFSFALHGLMLLDFTRYFAMQQLDQIIGSFAVGSFLRVKKDL
jgi:hypothetical protein